MQREDELKSVTKEVVQSIASWSLDVLQKHAENVPADKPVSAATAKFVARRLSAKGAEKYTTVKTLPQLVSVEVSTFCERIRVYPFVTRYREAINKASPEMIAAWQLHSHSLRQNELYVLHERGEEILEFAHLVAAELGLGTENRARKFQKRFNRRFEWRLRDRHRVVHAKERPSMTSRVADMIVTSEDITKDKMQEYAFDLLMRMYDILPGEKATDPRERINQLLALRETHVQGAEGEALQMIEIFVEELSKTIIPLP